MKIDRQRLQDLVFLSLIAKNDTVMNGVNMVHILLFIPVSVTG